MRLTSKITCLLGSLIASAASAQTPVGDAFTYQGKLTDGGAPATGQYDLTFRLYTAPSALFPIGNTVALENVQVNGGLFTVRLDFGAQFTGEARWLGVSVRPGASTGAFTVLSPRQEVTPAPYASGLSLPFTASGSTNDTLLDTGLINVIQAGSANGVLATNSGTGAAGYFRIVNNTSTNAAVYCTTSGTGPALWANGLARVDVLEITGGSDLSEGFEVGGESVKPGMLVCIDAERSGHLKVATSAADPAVAGVISGAGGVATGMVMGQEGTLAAGKHPVALTGRVYCYADASKGAIKPGDLLTTSDTPGHAMKATDAARASGAIVGKAMTSLEEGTGLILVLVNLQ